MQALQPDYRHLAPEPAAQILRVLALRALHDLLEMPSGPALPSVAPLDDWFGELATGGPLPEQAIRQLSKRFIFGSAELDGQLHRAIVGASIRPDQRLFWARQMIWRFRNRHKTNRAVPGVSQLIAPLIQHAFGDVQFRQNVASLVLRYLASRVLFHPDPPPVAHLAPQTILMLILARPVLANPAVTGALATHCHEIEVTRGWAGFWDQWCLGQVALKPDWTLPAVAERLPLMRNGLAALSGTDETDPDICTTTWRQKAPAYCHQLISKLP
jgi:hypothetical protein